MGKGCPQRFGKGISTPLFIVAGYIFMHIMENDTF
jgi:hypothetical protein